MNAFYTLTLRSLLNLSLVAVMTCGLTTGSMAQDVKPMESDSLSMRGPSQTDMDLQLAFHTLYGEILGSASNGLTDNDRELVIKAVTDTSYTDNALDQLSEACDYYESVGSDNLDVSHMVRLQVEAHYMELSDREDFRVGVYESLSPEAKARVIEIIDKYGTPVDAQAGNTVTEFVDRAEQAPEDFKAGIARSCERLPSLIADTGNNSPMKVYAIGVQGNEEDSK